MITTTVDTKNIPAGNGGQSTPVKLLLAGDVERITLEMVINTTRVAGGGNIGEQDRRPEFCLYWTYSVEDFTALLAQVPMLMRQNVKTKTFRPSRDVVEERIIVADKAMGPFLYVWFDYPSSQDVYDVLVASNQFSDSGSSSATTAGGLPLTVTTGEGYSFGGNITRPNDTTAYAIGDVVGENPATNLAVTPIGPAGGRVVIDYVAVEIDVGAVPAGLGAFRVHIFNAAPTAIVDNAAFTLIAGDRTKYLGYIDVQAPQLMGATLWEQNSDVRLQVKLAAASTTLYIVVQTLAAYTPTAQVVLRLHMRAFRIE